MAQTNYTPISLYYSTTASAVPTAANLVPGELAINTNDGKLYYEDSSGVVQVLATKSTGSIGGSNTQVQFNNSGSLGGSSGLTWDGSFLTTSSIKNSALTSGRVTYAGASGLLTDSANLLYSGTDLTVYGLTVGRGGGAISTNTAVGASALAANTTGVQNTVVGASAGASITTNAYLSAVGYQAAYYMTDSNDAFGRQALYGQSGATGYYNVGVGFRSGYSMTSGSLNTAIGNQALYSNTTASNNTAVGYQALYSNLSASTNTAVGYQAGYSADTGGGNTFVGISAGSNITSGQNGLFVGNTAQASSSSVNNELVIGSGASFTGKGASTGFITPNGGGVYQGNNSTLWSITSDARLKKNIVNNNTGLDKITAIQVRNFEYRLPEEITDLPQNQAIKKEGVQLGVIAQELQQILPECVKTESTGVMTVDADNLTWYMINAIKELKAEFDAYKATHP
jgi:hypothetical protein